MRFADLVDASLRIGATRSRREKIETCAALIRRLGPTERRAALCWLAGRLSQGRIGLGYAAVQATRDVATAAAVQLEIDEVERRLEAIAEVSGKGSGAERQRRLADAMLVWQTERLLSLAASREGHVVQVRPELVVEVAFDGVQTSPHYPAGLALRFARVIRHRPDKDAARADTVEAVRTAARATGSGRATTGPGS
jgi:ATP-dependent DNA ligase